MSTKTSIKRIALVAVSALGLGLMAVVPAKAANSADVMTLGSATSSGVLNVPVTTTVSITGISDASPAAATATAVLLSAPATSSNVGVLPTFTVTAAQATANTAANNTSSPTAGVLSILPTAGGRFTGTGTLSMTADVAGTYVYRITPGGSVFNTTAQTWTVTIAAPAVATAASSRVYMTGSALSAGNQATDSLLVSGAYTRKVTVSSAGVISYNSTVYLTSALARAAFMTDLAAKVIAEDADATNVSSLAVPVGTAGSSFWAQLGVIVGNGTTSLATNTLTEAVQNDASNATPYIPSSAHPFNVAGYPVTVSISGPGWITYDGVIKGKSYTEVSTDGMVNYMQKSFGIVSDGTTGTSTITVSQGSTVLATRTIVSYGALASLTATVVNKQIPLSATKTGAVTVVGKDATGNVVPVTPTVTSATTTSIASGTCSASTVTTPSSCDLLAGATTGSSVLTFTSGTITTTATVAASGKPTAVTLAFDKAEYVPGEKFTLTLKGTNTAGVPGDATYAALLAGALTTSQAITSALFGASVALVDGVATATGFMPLVAGDFTVSGSTGADATTAAVAVTATAKIAGGAVQAAIDAAADAAAEAIDAANAATDAANLAAEAADAATVAAEEARDAADAATAAVEELAQQVATLMAALKAQITTLANTVAKIAKKVKA